MSLVSFAFFPIFALTSGNVIMLYKSRLESSSNQNACMGSVTKLGDF